MLSAGVILLQFLLDERINVLIVAIAALFRVNPSVGSVPRFLTPFTKICGHNCGFEKCCLYTKSIGDSKFW